MHVKLYKWAVWTTTGMKDDAKSIGNSSIFAYNDLSFKIMIFWESLAIWIQWCLYYSGVMSRSMNNFVPKFPKPQFVADKFEVVWNKNQAESDPSHWYQCQVHGEIASVVAMINSNCQWVLPSFAMITNDVLWLITSIYFPIGKEFSHSIEPS